MKTVGLSQYADDNTLFLDGRVPFENAMLIIEQFGMLSGLKVNYEKTDAMWIGAARGRNEQLARIHWKLGLEDNIKILGVMFSSSHEASTFLSNWEPKLQKIEALMSSLQRR